MLHGRALYYTHNFVFALLYLVIMLAAKPVAQQLSARIFRSGVVSIEDDAADAPSIRYAVPITLGLLCGFLDFLGVLAPHSQPHSHAARQHTWNLSGTR